MLTGEMAYYCICLVSLLCCSFGSQLGIHLTTVLLDIRLTADESSAALLTDSSYTCSSAQLALEKGLPAPLLHPHQHVLGKRARTTTPWECQGIQ